MKTSIATGLVLAGIIAGLYFLYTSDMVKNYLEQSTKEITKTQLVPNESISEFGIFSQYIKTNLTAEEKELLKEVMAEREKDLERAYKILDREFGKGDGNMDEAFAKADEIRNEIKEKLLPYIEESEQGAFEEKYRQSGAELESEYVGK